ncbi:odorant receptor 94b-like isoform X1 [Drosophila miranda]|uniref:odorant receptor 94b-like isoform X1 n=1 Tax=Drosophila miranda TaxID=7229 RepID=UPI0007E72AB4|nr:odorant receptor 94b-like isoform X1 [Drosophila miranda]
MTFFTQCRAVSATTYKRILPDESQAHCEMERLRELTQRIRPSDVDEGRIGSIELNVWLAQLTGLPLSGLKPETKAESIRILVVSGVVLPLLFCYVVLEIYDLVLNWDNVDIMTQNVVMTLTHVGYWFKVLNTFYYYEDIKRIVFTLKHLTRTCVLSPAQRETFHQLEVENKVVCLFYFCLVVFSSTLAMVMLLIVPDNLAGKRFPYRVHMPHFLPPIVQYLYMGLSVIWISCGIPTIDNVNMLFMNQICMHLKILNMAFDVLQRQVDPNIWMVSIVKYHSVLINLRQRLEQIYRLPVLFQFVSSLLVVAMTAFQAIVGDGSGSSVLIYFLFSGVMCQIFLYCWFGNEVFEQVHSHDTHIYSFRWVYSPYFQSKTLSTSAFGCNWHEFDAQFKRTLLIFMINADRPFLFTAGGFMGLTLTSFANILGKSYSIVAVLRHMYGRAH